MLPSPSFHGSFFLENLRKLRETAGFPKERWLERMGNQRLEQKDTGGGCLFLGNPILRGLCPLCFLLQPSNKNGVPRNKYEPPMGQTVDGSKQTCSSRWNHCNLWEGFSSSGVDTPGRDAFKGPPLKELLIFMYVYCVLYIYIYIYRAHIKPEGLRKTIQNFP